MPKEILQFVQKPRKASAKKKAVYGMAELKAVVRAHAPRRAMEEEPDLYDDGPQQFEAPAAYGQQQPRKTSDLGQILTDLSKKRKRKKPHRCIGGCGSNECRSVLYYCSQCHSTLCNGTGLISRDRYHMGGNRDRCGPMIILRKNPFSKITIRTS